MQLHVNNRGAQQGLCIDLKLRPRSRTVGVPTRVTAGATSRFLGASPPERTGSSSPAFCGAERKVTDTQRRRQLDELRSGRELATILDFYEVFNEQLSLKTPLVINDLEEALVLSDGQAPSLLYTLHKVSPQRPHPASCVRKRPCLQACRLRPTALGVACVDAHACASMRATHTSIRTSQHVRSEHEQLVPYASVRPVPACSCACPADEARSLR